MCVCARFPSIIFSSISAGKGPPDSALFSVAPPPHLPCAAQTGPSALLSHSFSAAPPWGLPYGPCSPRSFSSVGPLALPGMEFGLSYSRVWGVSHWAVPLGCECPLRPPGHHQGQLSAQSWQVGMATGGNLGTTEHPGSVFIR